MQKIKTYIKAHRKTSIVSAIALLIILFFVFSGGSSKGEVVTVVKGDVKEQVIVTGNVKPAQEVDLAFERVGKVRTVSVAVGSQVQPGQVLVSLDSGETYAEYLKAQASVEAEQAELDQLVRGSRPEELAIASTEVGNAEMNFKNAQEKLRTALSESFINSDDIVHNSVDQLFSNPKSSNPQINIPIDDTQLKNDINLNRVTIEALLLGWDKNSNEITTERIVSVSSKLNQIKVFLDLVARATNNLSANSSMSATTVEGYKASIANARSLLITTQNNISAAEDKVNTTNGTLRVAQRNYELKKAGTTEEDIRAQKARVLQAQGSLQSVSSQLEKMTLRAPFAGIVTTQDAKVGGIVGANTPVISLISNTKLQIEANVSEINVGKINVGNGVDITMDAFKGKTFAGTIAYIDPGETLVNGVVNFKVTVTLNEAYPELKTGLSTNLTINTKQAHNVLKVPAYAITSKDGGLYITKQINEKQTTEVLVETGLSGTDGFVEVTKGLVEGDMVLVGEKK